MMLIRAVESLNQRYLTSATELYCTVILTHGTVQIVEEFISLAEKSWFR